MAKGFIAVKPEVEAVQKALSGTATGLTQMQRQVLSIAAKGTRKKIIAGIRATTKRRTGELLKAYRYKVRKDASEANVYPRKASKKSQIFPKVYTLNYGLKGTRYMARGFVERGEQYAEAGEYMQEANKYVQKELDKYWG